MKIINQVRDINTYHKIKRNKSEFLDDYYLLQDATYLFKAFERACQLNFNRNQIKSNNLEQFKKINKNLENAFYIILNEFYI